MYVVIQKCQYDESLPPKAEEFYFSSYDEALNKYEKISYWICSNDAPAVVDLYLKLK